MENLRIKKVLLAEVKDVTLNDGEVAIFNSKIPFSEYSLFEVFAETSYISIGHVCSASAKRLVFSLGIDQNSVSFGILDFSLHEGFDKATICSINCNRKAAHIRVYGIKIES